jgi:DNA-binding HxlR family transcriptional regulator
MANLQQSKSGSLGLHDEDLNELFDIYLRPLRSRNARTIYRIFLDEREKGELTTLDLQARLDQGGVYLSKKEINAWLRTLLDATLISKGEARGKPTTIEYNGRYSFDLWSLTRKGLEMADVLEIILAKKGVSPAYDLEGLSDMMDVADVKQAKDTLEKIEDSYLLITSIRTLWKAGRPVKSSKLAYKITPVQTTLDKVISSESGKKFIELRAGPASPNIIEKILHRLGVHDKEKRMASLTLDGKRLAERLWGEK